MSSSCDNQSVGRRCSGADCRAVIRHRQAMRMSSGEFFAYSNDDVEVSAVVENSRVGDFKLALLARAATVFLDQGDRKGFRLRNSGTSP